MSNKALFDAIRGIKGSALTLADVAAVNRALGVDAPAPVVEPGGMRTSPAGIALIHSFEQCRLTAYPDPGSAHGEPWTIGWGSTGSDIRKGVVWTQAQCDDRFARDLMKFEQGVTNALRGAAVTQPQFDALVSFAYNCGLEALRSSTLLRMHVGGDYAGAQAQFARWNKNDGKVMNGLTRRRAAEAARYGAPA